jgi:AcrR family transcriptional regulator
MRHSDKEQQILSEAVRLFSKNTYYKTSVREIAESVGLQKQSLYHYFRSKEDIYFKLVHMVLTEAVDKLKTVVNSNLGFIEKFNHVLALHLYHLSNNRGKVSLQLFMNRDMFDSTRRAELRSLEKQLDQMFRQLLREGQISGSFRSDLDIPVLQYVITGMFNYMERWYSPNGRLSLEQILHIYKILLLNGMLTPEQKTREQG